MSGPVEYDERFDLAPMSSSRQRTILKYVPSDRNAAEWLQELLDRFLPLVYVAHKPIVVIGALVR